MHRLVSVIIVNWNEENALQECLSSLAHSTYTPIEIIVVDNGSTDGSIAMLKESFPSVTIIQNKENLGFAEPNNQGYRIAKGEYILLLNSDTKVQPDFLDFLVRRIESNEKIAVVQPKILVAGDPKRIQVVGSYLLQSGFLYHKGYFDFEKKYTEGIDIFSACGACMLIRRSTIEQIGLFDKEYFAYIEETDFCWRVWLAGYRVVFEPSSVIIHKGAATSINLHRPFIEYHAEKNRLMTVLKNVGVKRLFIMLPLHLFFLSLFLLLLLYKREWKYIYAIFCSLWWTITHLFSTLKKRIQVQKNIRRVSDDDLFSIIMQRANLGYYIHLAFGTLFYSGKNNGSGE